MRFSEIIELQEKANALGTTPKSHQVRLQLVASIGLLLLGLKQSFETPKSSQVDGWAWDKHSRKPLYDQQEILDFIIGVFEMVLIETIWERERKNSQIANNEYADKFYDVCWDQSSFVNDQPNWVAMNENVASILQRSSTSHLDIYWVIQIVKRLGFLRGEFDTAFQKKVTAKLPS